MEEGIAGVLSSSSAASSAADEPIKAFNASISLTHDLINHGTEYDQPTPQLYYTTLGLIFFLHIIFFLQWKKQITKRDVAVTYEKIVRKKQFYKLLVALVSHPAPDGSRRMTDDNLDNDNDNDNNYDNDDHMRRRGDYARAFTMVIRMGNNDDGNTNTNTNTTSRRERWRMLQGTIIAIFKHEIFYPLINGHLAGLPLLTYISHILWQCRTLEEVFDYPDDSQYPNLYHHQFNVSTIIQRDTIIQKELHPNFEHTATTPTNTSSHSENYSLRYYRVLLALIITSCVLDIATTYVTIQNSPRMHSRRNTIHGLHHVRVHEKRSICTLTSLCTSLLIIYNHYFPYTPISILPFINTSKIPFFGSSAEFVFLMSYAIISILSFRFYPLLGVLYGTFSGVLWSLGINTFLADVYWCKCCILIIFLGVAFSLKLERERIMSISTSSSTSQSNERRGKSRFDYWLSWIDYVNMSQDDNDNEDDYDRNSINNQSIEYRSLLGRENQRQTQSRGDIEMQ